MGRMAIIAVVTLLFTLSIIGYNINRRADSAVKNYAGYYDETRARDIASSAAEIYIRKLAVNPSLRGTSTIGSLLGGSATVNIDSVVGVYDVGAGTNLDTLLMTTVGEYNDVTDTIVNKLYPVPITIPPIEGAIGMSAGQSASVKISGNAQTSGIDMNPDGTPVTPADSVPGITINSTVPSSNVSVSATASVTGNGTLNPDTARVTSLPNYTSFANEMIRLAKVYSGQTFSSSSPPLGTPSAPQISYITGNTTMSGTCSGYGILIINGNLTMSGQFTFQGLIIAYGQASISIQTTGQSTVYGAVVIAGSNTSYTQSGKSVVQYSKSVIKNVQQATVGRYLIEDWWE